MLKKVKGYVSQNIVYIIYAMFIFASSIALTSWATIHPNHIINNFLKVIRYISYLGCGVCIVTNIVRGNYSKRFVFFFLGLLVVSGITIFVSGERTIFIFVLLIGCTCTSDEKKILKLSCIIQGGVLFLTIVCALTRITQNLVVDEERMRYSLGFAWASYAPNLFLFVSMQYMLLRRDKISWLELIVMEAINSFIFLQTDTKMSFLVLTVLVCVIGVNRVVSVKQYLLQVKEKFFYLKKVYLILPWVCAFFAVFLPLYRQESLFWKIMNSGFSGRLEYGKNAIMNYGFSLLGQKIDMQGFSVLGKTYEVYNYVDSSYLQIAIRYGIVLLAFICVLYGAALLKMCQRRDGRFLLLLLVILFLCVEEPFLFDVSFNVFPVLIFCDEDPLKFCFLQKKARTKK